MCIRDSPNAFHVEVELGVDFRWLADRRRLGESTHPGIAQGCLLYTSDAADERSSVDLGGRRIIKKKNTE